jgi:hypothetical protein
VAFGQMGGGPTMINDNDSSVIYSTLDTWAVGSDGVSDYHYSNFGTRPSFRVKGASAVVNFTGTGITSVALIIKSRISGHGHASSVQEGGPPVLGERCEIKSIRPIRRLGRCAALTKELRHA